MDTFFRSYACKIPISSTHNLFGVFFLSHNWHTHSIMSIKLLPPSHFFFFFFFNLTFCYWFSSTKVKIFLAHLCCHVSLILSASLFKLSWRLVNNITTDTSYRVLCAWCCNDMCSFGYASATRIPSPCLSLVHIPALAYFSSVIGRNRSAWPFPV